MAPKTASYAKASTQASVHTSDPNEAVAYLTITKLVRTHEPIFADPTGRHKTLGALVDAFIIEELVQDAEIHEINLELSDRQKDAVRGMYVDEVNELKSRSSRPKEAWED